MTETPYLLTKLLGPVFGLFALGAAIQTQITLKNELAISYIVVLGLEAVLAFGTLILKERLTVIKCIGFVLVVSGVGFLRAS